MGDQVLLLVIGAAIGFCSSIGVIIVERAINLIGKVRLFYRLIIYRADEKAWGVRKTGEGKQKLIVPLALEMQNTKKTPRVIRDLNLELFFKGSSIAKMKQIEEQETKQIRNSQVENSEKFNYGGDKGSYSFVLEPYSIQKQKCLFFYETTLEEMANCEFDSIHLTYFNEHNKKTDYVLRKDLNGWESGLGEVSQTWECL